MKLTITTLTGENYSFAVPEGSDYSATASMLYRNGGVWCGLVFIPWHTIKTIEVKQ